MGHNISSIHGITFEQALMRTIQHQMTESSESGGKVTKVLSVNQHFNDFSTHIVVISDNHPNRLYELKWDKKLDKKTFLFVLNKHNKLIERSVKKMVKNNSL